MFRRLVTMTMGLALSAGAAAAADLDRIIYAPELKRTVPVEIGNGWYLRGDIGYSVKTRSDRVFDDWRLDSDFSGGLGVGYQFTDFLRADVTADYTEGDVEGRWIGPFTSDFRAYTVLANAYVDLGTFVGFTPYVGAGAGGTYVDYAPFFSRGNRFDGGGDWRFTYALMAGVAYDINKSLKVDFGYRYLDVDGGDAVHSAGLVYDDDGYSKHEIRAGLRYSLW